MVFPGAVSLADEEDPLLQPKPRGRRAGRREQRRRVKQDSTTNEPIPASVQSAAAGDAPLPLSITLTPVGRDVELPRGPPPPNMAPLLPEPSNHVRRSLFPEDEIEIVGTVYEAGRFREVGRMTMYGLPVTGFLTMGNRAMGDSLINATYLAAEEPVNSVPIEAITSARALVSLMDIHRRAPAGTFWFNRGASMWAREMELSQQDGAIVSPGRHRIRIIYTRLRA